MTQNDESSLVSTLRSEFEVVVMRPVYYSDEDRVVDTLPDFDCSPTDRQLALTSAEFIDRVVVTRFPKGHTRIDLINSSVIEFTRCKIDGRNLRPGRFWYQLQAKEATKSVEFKKWSAKIFRFIKRSLVKLETSLESYSGQEAEAQSKEGELELTAW
jgi:hypothetical protein